MKPQSRLQENVVAVIPARMASTRFPGKPLAAIHGIPMVGHVYFRTRMARLVRETYVATCDQEIYEYVLSIGGRAVMTSDRHERCSDRAAEALLKIEEATSKRVDILVMVQGDEPMVEPAAIDRGIEMILREPSLNILCLMAPIESVEEFEDPNQVKVVVDDRGFALYFSREPIPSRKKGADSVPMYKQYPIIPFRRDYLLRFNALPPTPLERVESVDLLRILEHGEDVRMVAVDRAGLSVDTPRDLERVVGAMEGDPLLAQYSGRRLPANQRLRSAGPLGKPSPMFVGSRRKRGASSL